MQTEVLKREEFVNCDKKLPVIVGEDENGKLVIEDLRELNSLLVVGQVGTPRVPFNYALICLSISSAKFSFFFSRPSPITKRANLLIVIFSPILRIASLISCSIV